ncbi:MAG: uroporphyrinogen-III synthase [Methylococcales bacterium]
MNDQNKPLQDSRILITRPKLQSKQLSELIEQAGGQAILFPVLEIIAPNNTHLIHQQLSKTEAWDWIIFTSANAVNHAITVTNNQLPIKPITKIAAIGLNTANSLSKHGITVNLIPNISSSEGLASTIMQLTEHRNCLIIKGEGGRNILQKCLIQHGGMVTTVDVYRRICPDSNTGSLLDQWRCQAIDYVTVTSVEGLNNLIQLIGDQGFELLQKTTIVALSQRIRDAGIKTGLSNIVVASSTSDKGIFETIVHCTKT